MATIYSSPTEIALPIINWEDMEIDIYQKEVDRYYSELKAFCLKRKKGKNVGTIVKFQIADGYAEYMVSSMRPLELIHLPIGDEYQFPYIQNLTAKDIQQRIDQQIKLDSIFKK